MSGGPVLGTPILCSWRRRDADSATKRGRHSLNGTEPKFSKQNPGSTSIERTNNEIRTKRNVTAHQTLACHTFCVRMNTTTSVTLT